ncbi:MAG: hypothetical protein HYZ74_09310, partial [Elusimicrobia bacterium]|nr:hypothetical protein [Elusimicrobiota bacterium]
MIKHALSLYLSLFLAGGPAAAQLQEAASAGKTGKATAAAAAANFSAKDLPPLPAVAGLAGSLSGGAAPIISQIEAASKNPDSLRALVGDSSPAAVYARALIAAPIGVAPEARAAAVVAMNEATVARIEAAVKTMSASIAGSARAKTALAKVASDFESLSKRSPETFVAGSASAAATRLSRPARFARRVKQAAVMAMVAAAVAISPVIHAQNAPAKSEQAARASALVHASDINDALAKWTPATRLIIVGDVGLDEGAQKSLAAWLTGKHWTVILMKNQATPAQYRDNKGPVFVDEENRVHRGEDALKFAIGQGIPHKSGFSSFVHEGSGLPDGSVFITTLEEHFYQLHNSEAQKVHGLSAKTEFGSPDLKRPTKLDRWFIDRMRNGHDTVAAIKDTVTNMDGLLDAAVASAASNAKTSLASAKSSVDNLARARAPFERSHPVAAGSVGAADIPGLRARLAAAEKAAADKKPAESARIAAEVSGAADAATRAMAGYESNFGAGKAALATARADVDALDKATKSFQKDHPKAAGDL